MAKPARTAARAVWSKLNLPAAGPVVVLGAPAECGALLAALGDDRLRRALPRSGTVAYALAFATRRAELDARASRLVARAADDAILWFAYPKMTSTRYACDFNRDTGWDTLDAAGFEPVRQVALDADWSALRFRRTAHVRSRPAR